MPDKVEHSDRLLHQLHGAGLDAGIVCDVVDQLNQMTAGDGQVAEDLRLLL